MKKININFMLIKSIIGLLFLMVGLIIYEHKQIAGSVLIGIFSGLYSSLLLTSTIFIKCKFNKREKILGGDEIQNNNNWRINCIPFWIKIIISITLLICSIFYMISDKSEIIRLICYGIFTAAMTIMIDMLSNIFFQSCVIDQGISFV